MRLTCFYTPDFEPLAIRFLSGISEPLTLNCIAIDPTASGGLGGGIKIWEQKTRMLIEEASRVSDDANDLSVILDIDIAIYGPLRPAVAAALADNDIVFQREDGVTDAVNIGVIAFRPSPKVARFWKDVLRLVGKRQDWDQGVVNELISNGAYRRALGIRIGYLPASIWARTQMADNTPIGECLLHHANSVSDPVGKWLQLNNFQPLFEKSRVHRGAARITVTRHLTSRTWVFGRLGNSTPYGTMTFDESLMVKGYENPNENRLRVLPTGFAMIATTGICTTIFDEFYIDAFRDKMMAVGRFFDDPVGAAQPIIHYLLASL